MRKILTPVLALLALLLASCTPALTGDLSRNGDAVTVVVEASQDLYFTTAVIVGAETDDNRCLVVSGEYHCVLGDLTAGTYTTILVWGPVETVGCTIFAFVNPNLSAGSYRITPCTSGRLGPSLIDSG